MLLHHFFDQTATRLPAKTALVCGDQRHSYSELAERVDQAAAALQARGIMRGDRVALFMDNTAELVVNMFAALKAGAVFMPISPLTKQAKLHYLLNDSGASALITQASLASTTRPALTQASHVHTVWHDGRPEGADDGLLGPDAALIDQDLACLIYTSGTTGEPKGVMLSHLNMVSAARAVNSYLGLLESDVILCALPLAFSYGIYQVLMGFAVGATVVLERSFAFPVKVLEVMARERATVFPGVPTIFSALANVPTAIAQHDLSALRLITNAGAALPEALIGKIRGLFPQAQLLSMYGMTECKRVTYLPHDQLDIRPTSVGKGMPNQEVWLVDEAGQRLPPGSTGELVIRGSHVMRGYWGKPIETAQRLRPGPLPGETVLYSGDLFRTDAEGYLYFVSRKDDIIKSRGEKVSPREVENALYALEGVFEAAVVGVPDDLLGQAVKAFVVPKPGITLSEREVIKHCLGCLESFMAPKHVQFVDSLPTTDTGKIRKAELN
ncbi:MAG: AMP-binding protein [Pseudomonadota bacterium]